MQQKSPKNKSSSGQQDAGHNPVAAEPKPEDRPEYIIECIGNDRVWEIEKILKQNPARANQPRIGDYGGNLFPLHFAARWNRVKIARLLIAAGADVNAVSYNGLQREPAIYYAVMRGKPEFVEMLLQAGGNANHQDEDGKSLLHLAAEKDVAVTIDILLKYGADISAIDDEGKTPMQRAQEAGKQAMVACFQRKMDEMDAAALQKEFETVNDRHKNNLKSIDFILRHRAIKKSAGRERNEP